MQSIQRELAYISSILILKVERKCSTLYRYEMVTQPDIFRFIKSIVCRKMDKCFQSIYEINRIRVNEAKQGDFWHWELPFSLNSLFTDDIYKNLAHCNCNLKSSLLIFIILVTIV